MQATMNHVVTIRLIRSFEYRNIQHIVFQSVDLTQDVATFKNVVNNEIQTRTALPPPFRKFSYDTLKISHKAFGAKSSDPVINTEDDDKLILIDNKTLNECGVGSPASQVIRTYFFGDVSANLKGIIYHFYGENETEISYFKLEDYRKYQLSKMVK